MVKLEDSDFQFIKENVSAEIQEKLFSAETLDDLLDVFDSWLMDNDECWTENLEGFSDLGKAAMRVYNNMFWTAKFEP